MYHSSLKDFFSTLVVFFSYLIHINRTIVFFKLIFFYFFFVHRDLLNIPVRFFIIFKYLAEELMNKEDEVLNKLIRLVQF